jgi:hypothetical protein
MQRDSSKAVIRGGVVELFSDMMLMKFKPKNTEGMRLAKDMHPVRRRLLSEDKIGLSENQQASQVGERLNHIQFLEVASKEAVIIGNVNQLDMIGLDGLTHNFVDTYHYWSLNISRPILDLKVNPKSRCFFIQNNYSSFFVPKRYCYSAIIRSAAIG